MYEKVNPKHPDKLADRIAGAIVDKAYSKNSRPKVAVEVLLGHGECLIINETDTPIEKKYIEETVKRIAETENIKINYKEVAQDQHLSNNQSQEIRCGDNGIFKGVPITDEQKELIRISQNIYKEYCFDGKYIINDNELIICQSHEDTPIQVKSGERETIVNPIGYWTGGIDVDSGATNRKLGSDMGDGVTGGGLHGKDLSKADVSINIYCHLLAQKLNKVVTADCAIGDRIVRFKADGKDAIYTDYTSVVDAAKRYIQELGGFEKFAEWGLLR